MIDEYYTTASQSRIVTSKIKWSAIFAGATLTLSILFLLGLLGGAAGLSLRHEVGSQTLQTGAIVYLALSLFGALFIGGLVSSLLTTGESKQDAILAGLLVWGVAFLGVALLGVAGLQTGTTALSNLASRPVANWEADARQAGVTDAQLQDLKAKNATVVQQAQEPANQEAAKKAATQAAWYGFFITWISMMIAAIGAYVGAGSTFRVLTPDPNALALREELLGNKQILVGSA